MSASSLSNKKRSRLALVECSNITRKIVERNDDLLMAILVLLPAKSIFRFRCVSKRWNNIISSPFFLQSYYTITKGHRRLLACILQKITHIIPSDMSLLPVPSTEDHNIDASSKLKYRFVNSSNGLFLFKTWWLDEYHILNPLTNRSISVPPLPPQVLHECPAVALVCEENAHQLNLNYKVVAAGNEESNTLTVVTFSSRTCKWTTSTLTATGMLHSLIRLFAPTLVVDGIIHWFTDNMHLAVYDSNEDTLSGSKHHIQLIRLPYNIASHLEDPIKYRRNITRSSRDDALWLCVEYKSQIKIWMLPSGEYDNYRRCSETIPGKTWTLMHDFSYEPLWRNVLLEEDKRRKHVADLTSLKRNSEFTQLVVLNPWNLPLVALLNLKNRFYNCNLADMKSFELVMEYTPSCNRYFDYYGISPYMEPLFLSSYAL